ncbi:MAG: hypothetical protein WBI40_00785, partial [Methylococcaceae bacterium]
MKFEIKLNHYIISFFLLAIMVIVVGDAIKFKNYRATLIQNYSNKYINITQQIREDYRLLFDRLQYQFDKHEAVNISKLNQLYKIYKRDGKHFNVDKAAEELNKDVYFGHYEVFVINKDYIIEDGSYKVDIGLSFSQAMIAKKAISSIFNKTAAIDISPVLIDSSSMGFNRYFIRLSHDEKYVLQIAFLLDFSKELKEKYNLTKNFGLIKLYLCNAILHKFEFDKTSYTKKSAEENWQETKNFMFQIVDDLSMKDNRLEVLTKLDIKNNEIHINELIDKLFNDDKLLNHLNLSQHQFIIYSITDGVFNKLKGTKLIVKKTYSTDSLEKDIQATFIQSVIQLLLISSGFFL